MSVTFVLRQREVVRILYSKVKKDVTHVSRKLQAWSKFSWLNCKFGTTAAFDGASFISHQSSTKMRSLIYFTSVNMRFFYFVDAIVRYGFDGLLISLPRWNEGWRFLTEFICTAQSTTSYKHVARREPKSDFSHLQEQHTKNCIQGAWGRGWHGVESYVK